jgi:hypothetical protein
LESPHLLTPYIAANYRHVKKKLAGFCVFLCCLMANNPDKPAYPDYGNFGVWPPIFTATEHGKN